MDIVKWFRAFFGVNLGDDFNRFCEGPKINIIRCLVTEVKVISDFITLVLY